MKIELDINPGELEKSVSEIMGNLTPEQRVDVARQTMEKWLREPHDIERKAKEQAEVERIKKKDSWGRKDTEDEIRKGYEFAETMRGWKSTKEQMIATITQEIASSYKAQVQDIVAKDPTIQAMREEVIKIVKETFPAMVHQAMVAFMASNMNVMLNAAMGMDHVEKQAQDLQTNLTQRLNEVESRMAFRG